MKKILIFGAFLGFFACTPAFAAVRDGGASSSRTTSTKTTQTRTTTPVARTSTGDGDARNLTPIRTNTVQTRAGTLRTTGAPRTTATRTRTSVRSGGTPANATRSGAGATTRTTARATTPQTGTVVETRTGAAYNQCKNAYFQCMDQFCQLKNDDYRRCSCSSRIYDLIAQRTNLSETGAKLTEFTENLDIVGMSTAQATAIRTASDGENALTADTSASKALLTAIMNSIRGEDATVAGKMSGLNSINLSFDTSVAFGTSDNGQLIASYNGTELYNAVYAACRSAVKNDCNDAALQRAVTAYLMAIEQDCNTVQTALGAKQKELKAAIREGSAMLDLARVENRQKHNSDDKATCIANVEAAVLSEQVCGTGYHKCLDNGEFIDITTGAPIAGVVNFYELANILNFDFGKSAAEQKLAQNPRNRTFVKNFETKTKKFAADALDKCTEIADSVWQDYLDKALLDIYYAQRAKVETIKTGCFDLISSCYSDREASITAAMSALIDGSTELLLQPDKIVLTNQMCSDYIASCDNMFGDNIISDYIATQTQTDTLAACRAIAEQCFSNFGGTNYENFYRPTSGLFTPNTADSLISTIKITNSALDWFALYEYDDNGERVGYKSECAKQIASMPNCVGQIESVFGGLDAVIADQSIDSMSYGIYKYTAPRHNKDAHAYGWAMRDAEGAIDWSDETYEFKNRRLRPSGVATEIYNRIIDNLTTQCLNIDGKFVEAQFIDRQNYPSESNSLCLFSWQDLDYYKPNAYSFLGSNYGMGGGASGYENMCPQGYIQNVDTFAWGACLCWENGGRRSKNGLATKCMPVIAVDEALDAQCDSNVQSINQSGFEPAHDKWCTSTIKSETDQVCPFNDQNVNCPVQNYYVPRGNKASQEPLIP